MTISPLVLHCPAGVGIDQSTREEHVEFGRANLYAGNARLTKRGSLVHRQGFEQITNNRIGSSSRSAGARIGVLGKSILVSDGNILDLYSPSANEWRSVGRLPGCEVRRATIAGLGDDSGGLNIHGMTYANGFYFAVAVDAGATTGDGVVIGYVVDATTLKVVYSQIIDSGIVFDTILALTITAVGNNIIVMWADAATIKATRMDATAVSNGWAAPTNIVINYDQNGAFDLLPLTTRFAFAYGNNTGGTARLSLKTFNPSTLAQFEEVTITTASADITCVALAGSESEELWIAWTYESSTDVTVRAVPPTAITTGPTVPTTVAFSTPAAEGMPLAFARTAASETYLAAGTANASYTTLRRTMVRRVRNVAGVATVDRATTIYGWHPRSDPFVQGGRVYMEVMWQETDANRNLVLVDVTGDATSNDSVRPVAWPAPRMQNMFVTPGNPFASQNAVSRASGVYATLQLLTMSNSSLALSINEYDFTTDTNQIPLEYAGSAYFSGGIHYQFDGQRLFEANFIAPPRVITENITGSASLTGTFVYTAIHEWADATGSVIRSSAATVSTATPSSQDVRVTVQVSGVSWKSGVDSNTDLEPKGLRYIRTKVYRTENGGGTFYLVNSFTGQSEVTFTDATADAVLIGNPRLYRDPGVLGTAKDRQGVGAVKHQVEVNGVLVVLSEDGKTMRAFAGRVVGESPWHNDVLQLPIDSSDEAIALAGLDGACVVLTRREVFVVPVESSNAAITAGGFGAIRKVSADAGCIDPRSVVSTSLGVFFQSDRGIEVLTRNLSVEFIGERILNTYNLFPVVTSAVLDVRNAIVRISLTNTDGDEGLDAIFDLTIGEWVSFDAKTGAAASEPTVSATYGFHDGAWRYVWLEDDGTVNFESDDQWFDRGSTFAPMVWVPAWVKTELQREHQFWEGVLLHDRKSACGLRAEFATDWADYDAGNDKTWNEAAILAYPRQVELRWTKRGQAFKVRFTDTAPAVLGTGQGTEFVGLSVDLAPQQGPTKGTPLLAEAARR